MVDIQQPHLMPHAILSDSAFPPWQATKTTQQRTLPLPSSLEPELYSRQAMSFKSSHGYPPPSAGMTTSTAYRSDTNMERRDTAAISRPFDHATQAPSFPYYRKQPSYHHAHSLDTSSQTTPSRSTGLLLPDPPESRKPAANNSEFVAPALRMPREINAPQVSLPQLAAEITCLFWFENGNTLKSIESLRADAPPSVMLCTDSHPAVSFRKWVTTLLSTTQVTQNVVLLALLFIYKLKSFNPSVKGKPGSEYRLLTVALMLGNKFLDDNTYTNKTWADVSGISVQEIHIMEVEFLSNMRYSLYTSTKSWEEWHVKLGKFGSYMDRINKAWELAAARPSFTNAAPPVQLPGALPSPPVSNNASPPYLVAYSPLHVPRSNTPILLPQINSTAVSPIGPLPELDSRFSRKRSYDESVEQERPSKRLAPHLHPSSLPHLENPHLSLAPSSRSAPSATMLPRLPLPLPLPLPNLTIPPTSQATPMPMAPHLSRAMSMVYPPPPLQWHQHSSTSSTPVSHMQSAGLPPVPMSLPMSLPYIDQSRQLSPYPGQSATSSPMSATFTPLASQHQRLSPSYFLTQRQSPYRPVRQVKTLLVPPTSSSTQNAPQLIGGNEMQYHPLGKPMNERRVGHLPYIHHDAWPETNQANHWGDFPALPQPVFQRTTL